MRASLVVLVVALVCAACGGATAEGLELAPGDDLVARLRPEHIVAASPGNVPAALLADREQRQAERVILPADLWRDAGPADPAVSRFAQRWGVTGGMRRWTAPDAPPPPGADDVLRLVHEGRDLRRFLMGGSKPRAAGVEIADDEEKGLTAPDEDGPSTWVDRTGKAMFWWEGTPPVLHAVAPDAPGPLNVGAGSVALDDMLKWELPPDDPAARVRRVSPDGERQRTRVALLLAAPGIAEVPVGVLHGDGLSVQVSVLDHSFAMAKTRVVREPALSDGVVCAVDVVRGGVTERRWSERVRPGEAPVVAAVDLSDLQGSGFLLRLVTEPGPAGDSDWDYAAWSRVAVTGAPRRPPSRPHVVLIDIDTLRADRLGLYGHDRNTSPRLDAWAAREAVVYRDAVATSSWTIPSTASILTGLAVHQHRIAEQIQSLTAEVRPLSVRLRAVGYETRAVSELGMLSVNNGFDVGFDEFEALPRVYDRPAVPDWSGLVDWVATRDSERPFFLFLQTYMVHAPFHDGGRFPEPDPQALASLDDGLIGYQNVILPFIHGLLPLDGAQRATVDRVYDEGVARMDDVVADFLEGLEQALDGEDCLIIFTSDHGEELFEHEGLGHGHTLHSELLQVPLIVAYPGDGPTGTDERVASILDIVPTVLAEAGLPIEDGLPGRPLRAPAGPPRPRVSMLGNEVAVDFQGFKLMRREGAGLGDAADVPDDQVRTLLFDRARDRAERNDLSADVERVDQLLTVLADYLLRFPSQGTGPGEAGAMDDALLEQLRELGYVNGGDG